MTVDPALAKHNLQHEGKTYYFCCGHCAEKFRTEPGKFLHRAPMKPAPTFIMPGLAKPGPLGALSHQVPEAPAQRKREVELDSPFYVCPMCPEVRQVGPGPC